MERSEKIIIGIAVIIIIFLLFATCCLCLAHTERFSRRHTATKRTIRRLSPVDTSNTVSESQPQIEGYASISDPYIKPYVLPNLISVNLCNQIISECSNRIGYDGLHDSYTLSGKNDKIRNSKQCWIKKSDPLVAPIYTYLSEHFNIPVENAEDLQIVRYHPNQYYKQHHDACCDNHHSCDKFIKNGGQRKLTVLIYLNDAFTEGETHFPNLNLKMRVKPGSAIVFHPLAENSSKCHPYALHEGLPVKSGEKWIANVWFRERKYNT